MGRQRIRQPSRQPVRSQQVNSPKSKRALVRSKQHRALLKSVVWLFRRHTVLMWLVIWAVLIGATTAAVMSIVNPDASVRYSAANSPTKASPINPATTFTAPTAPVLESPQPATDSSAIRSASQSIAQTDNASPVFAVGAIILSCAAGCYWLSQCIKPQPTARSANFIQPPPRPARKNSPLAPADFSSAQPVPSQSAQTQIQPYLQAPAPLLKSASEDASPLPALSQPVSTPNLLSQPQSVSATVSLVPEHQSHPLDWDEPSLADALDIRQRRSLADWLWEDF